MYLDFFAIPAQNKALTVTANCCQGLLIEEFTLVQVKLSFCLLYTSDAADE